MPVLYFVSLTLLMLDCILLTVVVLFQDNRSGGLAGALGGGVPDSAFGARTAEKMSRLTIYLAVGFFVLVFSTGFLYRRRYAPPAEVAPIERGAPRPMTPGPPSLPPPVN